MAFWLLIKNQKHEFFNNTDKLWRCSHQATTKLYENSEDQLHEWNGALRWIHSDNDLYTLAEEQNGHAQRYPLANSSKTMTDIFHPLQPGILKIHKRLKQSFDPENILNPGRLYTAL